MTTAITRPTGDPPRLNPAAGPEPRLNPAAGPEPRLNPTAGPEPRLSPTAGGQRRLHPVAAGEPAPVNVPVRAIVATWGVTPRRVVRLGGDRNVHWSVRGPQGTFVLRCYRADRDAAAIAYEFTVLDHLAAAGWPVAPPVGPTASWRGRTFALFPRLPGRSPSGRERPAGQRRRGAMLADLHAALAPLPVGQRSGWRPLTAFMAEEAESLIRAAETRLAGAPALRQAIVRHTVATRQALADCPPGLPHGVVHGDFVPWNLLWSRGVLSGLIDFDDARYDLRATDVAIARRRDRDGVVAGYRASGGLADEELPLLAPLWRAYTLMFVADLLRAPTPGARVGEALDWCARELETTAPFGGG